MRKKICVFLSVALIISMDGCGAAGKKDKTDGSSTSKMTSQSTESESKDESSDENADSAATASSAGEADAGEVDSTAALNVAEDAFTFDSLIGQVGAPEADVLKMLGVQGAAEAYNAKLFGEDVTIALISGDDVVQEITVTFPATNIDSVSNAVSEQIAQDGESADGGTRWTFEDKTVNLLPDGDGCVISIK